MNEITITIISVTLLVLLLVAGIIITFFVSGRQSIRQQMELAETRLAFEKELRAVENEVTENIMGQFAHELHDNIGQLLTALHIQVENLKLDHPQLADNFKPAGIYISEISQQLRMLSRTLNNDYIGHIGLLGALQLEVERTGSLKRFNVEYKPVTGESNLEKNQELMVFRIFQEIVQNALRHSRAKTLRLAVDNSKGGFVMRVEDDGVGFDREAVLRSGKASGLRNIMKRASLAGLQLDIDSAPGKGSLFVIKKMSTLG